MALAAFFETLLSCDICEFVQGCQGLSLPLTFTHFLTLRGRLPRDGPLSTLSPTWFGVDKMVGAQISYWILKEAKTIRTYVIIACDTRGTEQNQEGPCLLLPNNVLCTVLLFFPGQFKSKD